MAPPELSYPPPPPTPSPLAGYSNILKNVGVWPLPPCRSPTVSGTTRARAGGAVRLARRSDSSTFIGEGADDHDRGSRAPRDQSRTQPEFQPTTTTASPAHHPLTPPPFCRIFQHS
jgi:hypothetical protein